MTPEERALLLLLSQTVKELIYLNDDTFGVHAKREKLLAKLEQAEWEMEHPR